MLAKELKSLQCPNCKAEMALKTIATSSSSQRETWQCLGCLMRVFEHVVEARATVTLVKCASCDANIPENDVEIYCAECKSFKEATDDNYFPFIN